MDGDGEVAYTADVGMTPLYEGEGAFKDYKPGKAKLVHTWYAYPWSRSWSLWPEGSPVQVVGDFSGKPVYFTPPAT